MLNCIALVNSGLFLEQEAIVSQKDYKCSEPRKGRCSRFGNRVTDVQVTQLLGIFNRQGLQGNPFSPCKNHLKPRNLLNLEEGMHVCMWIYYIHMYNIHIYIYISYIYIQPPSAVSPARVCQAQFLADQVGKFVY